MITINLFNYNTRLPLRDCAIQLVFTDTLFGWMRLDPTNAEGMTVANTYPGPARVYVDGELVEECWMEGEMKFLLKEGVNVEKENSKLLDEARPGGHKPMEKQSEPVGQLAVVLPDQATPPEFLIPQQI